MGVVGDDVSYDSKCYELAEHFLSDTPELATERAKKELAQHIQDEIEGWLRYEASPKKPVSSRPECIFRYCPTAELCETECINFAHTKTKG